MSSDTPTPRTDANERRIGWSVSGFYIKSDFARQLERDLTRAHEDKRALREAIQKLIVDCDFIGEERVSGRSVAKDLRKVLSATASPEPAKNTEGAK